MAYTVAQDHPTELLLDAKDQQLLAELRQDLRDGRAAEGIAKIRSRLAYSLPNDLHAKAALLSSLACRLVDFAGDAVDEQAAQEGLSIFRSNEDLLRDYFDLGLFEYNVGNALHTLVNFDRKKNPQYSLASIERLTESKDYYWRAIRARGSNERDWPELMINVANTLDECSRTPEALYWYDEAIRVSPDHPMAHGNRAQSLVWLKSLTDQVSINQLGQIHYGLSKAVISRSIPPSARPLWENYLSQVDRLLRRDGYSDIEGLYETIKQEQEEAPRSPYQKFCLTNGLILSEHSIYCHCAHDTYDGISIPKSTTPIAGDFVPRMELLLNRLKSEFALARCLLYQSYPTKAGRWKTNQFESALTDLLDAEVTGIKPEMLRTSFRLCFGILDRIAHGICDLLDLADPNESIFFHSFWRRPGGKSEKQRERWEKLNKESTPSLVALYSQATDLNIKKGQWGHLKEWRDKLEHELLFLVEDGRDLGPLQRMLGFKEPLQLSVSVFRNETLQLMRFTAAAIINFALFVRQRALRLPTKGGPAFNFEDRRRSRR
jgi:tetratricopeptide (TPR) repeat protein